MQVLINTYHELHDIVLKNIFNSNIYGIINEYLQSTNVQSAVIKPYKYPVCISINNVVCHGNIENYIIQDEDVINIDICLCHKKQYIDGCRSYVNRGGKLIPNSKYIDYQMDLYRNIEESWDSIIKKISLPHSIDYCYVHGLQPSLHSKPLVHIDSPNQKIELNKCYAFEVMYTESTKFKKIDQWVTCGNKNVFHIEDTLYITKDKVYILTYNPLYNGL